MNLEQATRLAVAFAREVTRSPRSTLCSACVELLAVTGAGVTLMGGDQAGLMCVSGERIAALEDLQFTVGVGPYHDAFRSGGAVHAPNLDAAAAVRWPDFVDLAQTSGVQAAFAFPLSLAGAKIGVLSLYNSDAGNLSVAQVSDSEALAEILTETVLSLQDDAGASSLAPSLEEAITYRAEIYQASGMVAVQLQIPVLDALLRIRARAFVEGRSVAAVAQDIVAGRLRFSDDDPASMTDRGRDG